MSTTSATNASELPTDLASLQNMAVLLLSEQELLRAEKSLLQAEQDLLKNHNGLLLAENQQHLLQIASMRAEHEALKEQLMILRAELYGKSSEKLDKAIDDIEFCVEENEASLELAEAVIETSEQRSEDDFTTKKRRPKRLKLPEHLPREDVVHAAPSVCPSCGGEKFRKISEDMSEVLERVPATAKVVRHIRPRCACVNCEQIVQAEAPENTIDKGKAGPGFLADVIIQKYADHLPLYRQSEIYKREGLEIPRSTMSGWVGRCVALLLPLVLELKKWVFTSSHLHGDDTPVPVLATRNR